MVDWIPTSDNFSKKTKDRFFKYIDKIQAGECWNWTGHIMSNGYGEFWYDHKPHTTHTFAYKMFFGEYPNFALVLHKCDNKQCVNPNHLYLGSHSQNLIDSYTRHPETKGRRWYADREAIQCR